MSQVTSARHSPPRLFLYRTDDACLIIKFRAWMHPINDYSNATDSRLLEACAMHPAKLPEIPLMGGFPPAGTTRCPRFLGGVAFFCQVQRLFGSPTNQWGTAPVTERHFCWACTSSHQQRCHTITAKVAIRQPCKRNRLCQDNTVLHRSSLVSTVLTWLFNQKVENQIYMFNSIFA